AFPSSFIVTSGESPVASWISATSPMRAAHPVVTVMVQGASVGKRREVAQSSPLRSGSKARAVAESSPVGVNRVTSSMDSGLPSPVPRATAVLSADGPCGSSGESRASEEQPREARRSSATAFLTGKACGHSRLLSKAAKYGRFWTPLRGAHPEGEARRDSREGPTRVRRGPPPTTGAHPTIVIERGCHYTIAVPMTSEEHPDRIVLHVAGMDRPGVTARLMRIIAEDNAELVDIGQSVLHGYLVLSAIVNIPQNSRAFRRLLFEATELGMRFEVTPFRGPRVDPSYTTPSALCVTVLGPLANGVAA